MKTLGIGIGIEVDIGIPLQRRRFRPRWLVDPESIFETVLPVAALTLK